MVDPATVATQEADVTGGDLEGGASPAAAAGENDRAASRGIEGQPVAGDKHAVAFLDALVGGLGHAAPAGHANPDCLDDPLTIAGHAHVDGQRKVGHCGVAGRVAHLGIAAGIADHDRVDEAVGRTRPIAVGILICDCKLLVYERME
jgi:hypothetical protein